MRRLPGGLCRVLEVLRVGAGIAQPLTTKDYRAKGATRHKTMTLSAGEFMRRFLLHVLPKGYFKIRYFGILASRNSHKLWTAQEILGNSEDVQERKNEESEKSFEEWFFELTGIEAGICPYCKKGRLIRKIQLAPAPS